MKQQSMEKVTREGRCQVNVHGIILLIVFRYLFASSWPRPAYIARGNEKFLLFTTLAQFRHTSSTCQKSELSSSHLNTALSMHCGQSPTIRHPFATKQKRKSLATKPERDRETGGYTPPRIPSSGLASSGLNKVDDGGVSHQRKVKLQSNYNLL